MGYRTAIISLLVLLSCPLSSSAAERRLVVKDLGPATRPTAVEFRNLSAGPFNPDHWRRNTLNLLPDLRSPLIDPLPGRFRNIYAPSVVPTPDGFRVFYGAWDGVPTGNDRLYSLTTPPDFLSFADRHTVIEHGPFQHVCNVSAHRNDDGSYLLLATAYPDLRGLNKPAAFSSPDGKTWNGAPAPYAARMSDLISIDGYAPYAEGDLNGMNTLLRDADGTYRLYFTNFKDFGRVYRASSRDGKHYAFDGPSLAIRAVPNDAKRFDLGSGRATYLLGLHMNGPHLWYALSDDGLRFDPPQALAKPLSAADHYIVAIGFVARDGRLLGFLYGAGAVPSLDQNRIFARWLQKKVTFLTNDGRQFSPDHALGPDRAVLDVGAPTAGRLVLLAEDGLTPLASSPDVRLEPGHAYELSPAAP